MPKLRFSAVFMALALLQGAFSPTVQAERPAADRLLPASTVAYVSVPSAQFLGERFMQTAIGRMSQDEQFKPVVTRLLDELKKAAAPLEDQLGISLIDLAAVPQGELTFAVIASAERPPAVLLLLDAKNEIVSVEMLLERADELLLQRGADKSTKTIAETEVRIYGFPGDRRRQAVYFLKDGVLVLGSDELAVSNLLTAWDSQAAEPLASNKQYSAIMKRCRGAEGEESQLNWFVDPIGLFKNIARENSGAQFASSLLTPLGLDGLQGVGGSVTFATQQFDAISRVHVLLENPRRGALELIALRSGDVRPENWVPGDVLNYTTFHWDVSSTYRQLDDILAGFQGQGALKRLVQSRLDQFNIDLEEDVLAILDDRITMTGRVQKPVSLSSSGTVFAFRVKDADKAQKLVDKLVAQFGERLEKDAYAGKTFYRIRGRQRRAEADQENPDLQRPRAVDPPEPCLALLDNYLMVSDRPHAVEAAIRANRDPQDKLSDAVDYQLIAGKISEISGGREPVLVNFNRPDEGLQFLYELAQDNRTRDRLRRGGENNGLFRALSNTLEESSLPPFEVLQKYLAPAGAVLLNDETGLHYESFTLRRQAD